jgi:N-methylhydantoinase A/oxoprolinase/acetone carboxylase beta subunit
LAKKLKAPRILVPPIAGVGSALGFFTAPVAFEVVRSHKVSLRDADFLELEKLFQEMETIGRSVVQKDETKGKIIYERSIDLRFIGQGYEVNVPIPNRDFSQMTKEEVRSLFDETYRVLYGRTYPESPLEFVTFNVRVRLPERAFRLPEIEKKTISSDKAVKGERRAYSPVIHNFIPHTVYDRYSLSPGAAFKGPAIIEERESTTIVGEDASVSVDDHGFLWMNLKEV